MPPIKYRQALVQDRETQGCRKGPLRRICNSVLAVEKARLTVEAACSPCPETGAPRPALDVSAKTVAAASSRVLLDARGVNNCRQTCLGTQVAYSGAADQHKRRPQVSVCQLQAFPRPACTKPVCEDVQVDYTM